MTAADQIVRHLLENEEDFDDADEVKDVGLPVPMGVFLGKHGFSRPTPRFMGFEKVWGRDGFMLRISDPNDSGTRTVQYFGGGALPLWTREMTDEEVVEMIDRVERIGENEEDEFDDVDTWKDLADTLPAAMEAVGFIHRGTNVWTFGINQWQSVIVTRLQDGIWHGQVHFQGVGAINEFKGTEIEMGRWLESMERWPKFHFSDWNKFEAAARGKSIREEEDFEDETFDSDTWKHVSSPPQENVNWKTVLKYFPNLPEIIKGNNITLRFEDNCLVIHHRLGPREWRYEVFRMENVVGDEWELVPLGSFNDYIEALQACVT